MFKYDFDELLIFDFGVFLGFSDLFCYVFHHHHHHHHHRDFNMRTNPAALNKSNTNWFSIKLSDSMLSNAN